MKIDRIKNKSTAGKTGKSTKKSGTNSISFAGLLGEQLNPLTEISSTVKSEEITESSSVSASTRLAGLAVSENTIDILASFAEALDNFNLSAADLLPLVEALQEETTAMLDIKEQLDKNDPLYALLDRVAAVAYLEAEKYHRGDYQK